MTETLTNTRVTVIDGWAVRNLDDGSQVRARLIPDPYHPEPERGDAVTLVRERDGYRGIDLDEHDGLSAVLDRFTGDDYWDANPESWGQGAKALPVDRETFVRRYLRAFHDVQHASMRHHQGYSQSDWADIWVIVEGDVDTRSPDNLADAIWSEWDAWAKGDIYTIESQTRTLTDAMFADGDDPDDGWQDGERVGGYYGDDGAAAGLAELLDVDPDDVPNVWDVMTDAIY